MNRIICLAAVMAVLILASSTTRSWSQSWNPTDSDDHGNTAGGRNAFGGNDPPSCGGLTGYYNTAFGGFALSCNSNGYSNTGVTPDGSVSVADRIFHCKGQSLGDFKRAWHSALMQAGFTYQEQLHNGKLRTRYTRCFHDFRRTAARNLVRAGIREGVAMSVTGHKTRLVFDRYNITSAEDVREAIEAVSKS